MTDVIIVGSGASAVHAAWPLAHAGLKVRMLDVGNTDRVYAPLIPERSFTEIRRSDPEQHRYFLGDQFEGIPFGQVRVGAQLTPPRSFITRDTQEMTPVDAPAFSGMESLAVGGLAAGWGAGVARFNDNDLASTPLTARDLEPHYRAVEERIGVCGEDDDLSAELGVHSPMMPALRPDSAATAILARYRRKREGLNRDGLRLGVARLAACSRPHRGRGPHPYHDLDFWADQRRAVYRPRWTLDELSVRPNMEFLASRLVVSFRERPGGVEVTVMNLETNERETHEARALVLAAGVMGTARIVLRSRGLYDRSLPLVANPYCYAPCLNLGMLGREPIDARHSLSQLTATVASGRRGDRPAFVSVYSYRSLLTFKLLKDAPLGARVGLRLLRALLPMMNILGIHHADAPSPVKSITLCRGGTGPDRLAVRYSLSDEQTEAMQRAEFAVLRGFRALGCYCLSRIRPGHGSSIHYAGTLPMSGTPGDLQTDRDGRLSGQESVVIADGSLLPELPAKGLTLTLMANADRIGTRLAERLK